jgi:hypothetical protein
MRIMNVLYSMKKYSLYIYHLEDIEKGEKIGACPLCRKTFVNFGARMNI